MEIKEDGISCVFWYKKASKIPTDVTETLIREFALANGLPDIKVSAIDEIRSGLRLVTPLKDRLTKRSLRVVCRRSGLIKFTFTYSQMNKMGS